MRHRQLVFLACSIFFLPSRASTQQVTLQPWVEVPGTINGQQLGKYVTGIVPSSNLPYRAAVTRVGSTGVYLLQTQSDTTVRQIFLGENLLTGDLNNDGFTDVVVGKTVNNYDTVYIYWGATTGIDTLNPLRFPAENQFDRLTPGAIGDIDNDGTVDLTLAASGYPQGVDSGKIYVFLGPVSSSTPYGTVVGDSARAGLGLAVSVADVNNDGSNDLVVRGAFQSAARRYDYVNVYWGVGVDTLNLTLGIQMKTRPLVVPALACFDVNGDGRADLLWTTADSLDTYVNIHYGRASFDTVPDLRLQNPHLAEFGNTIANAGDMNGDGYNDIVVGSYYSITSGFVIVYGGGPSIDPFFDAAVGRSADSYFGWSVASVGDVSGDGLSDIIVGAPNYRFGEQKGYWGIFKGDSTIRVTAVKEPMVLPTQFELHDAYPNPFNPSTTIGFRLNQSAHITIEIYDELGRTVTELINKDYSPGIYTAKLTASGLSSGIYFYRMTASTNGETAFQQTKRVTFLK